jgi:hypothetical protein
MDFLVPFAWVFHTLAALAGWLILEEPYLSFHGAWRIGNGILDAGVRIEPVTTTSLLGSPSYQTGSHRYGTGL